MVNNLDWTGPMSVLDFLRDIGKHFPVNRMLARDVVRNRLEDGISYTEFSYVLLQSLDYLRAVPHVRLHAAVRRQRPVGQHHRRRRADPAGRRRPGARPRDAAADQGRRHQVRQDRVRHHLARPGDDLAVRLPPVLPQRRGRQGGRLPQGVQPRAAARRSTSLARQTGEQPHLRAAQRALADDVTALVHSVADRDAAVAAADALFGRADLAS